MIPVMSDRRKRERRTVEDDASRLRQALAELERMLPTLSALLPEKSGQGPQTGTIGRHAPRSSEPWQAEAADAYWAIHAGVRDVSNAMREERGLGRLVWRGHDDATVQVFQRILNLIPGASDDLLAECLSRVEGWLTSAKQIADIDEADRWVPVPKVPGGKPPKCPYCQTYGLRMSRLRGEVRCSFPGCVDGSGRPTRARMETGGMTGEGVLVFGDDTTMHYREDQP